MANAELPDTDGDPLHYTDREIADGGDDRDPVTIAAKARLGPAVTTTRAVPPAEVAKFQASHSTHRGFRSVPGGGFYCRQHRRGVHPGTLDPAPETPAEAPAPANPKGSP